MRAFIRMFLLGLCCLLIGFFDACDSPIGLGTMVNTEIPVISIPGDVETPPGEFLSVDNERNRISFEVKQEFGIESVVIWVNYAVKSSNPTEWNTDNFPADYDPENDIYYHDLDVSGMEDGIIRTWAVATDISGKSTTTTELVYTVKNSPPQIEMTMPRIVDNDFDEDLDTDPPKFIIIQGSDIMGIATDLAGIAAGYPQIMMWHNGTPAHEIDGDDAQIDWTREFGQWHTVTNEKNEVLTQSGAKAVQFRWPLFNLQPDMNNPGKLRTIELGEAADQDKKLRIADDNDNIITYYFKIKVKDIFGRVNIYPYRLNPNPETLGGRKPSGRIAFQLVALTNPIIKVTEVVNEQRLYNRQQPFTADIQVTAADPIARIRAAIHNSVGYGFPVEVDSTILAALDEAPNGITSTGASIYRITIPVGKMPAANGEYFLHVQAIDRSSKIGTANVNFSVDSMPPTLQYIQPSGIGPAVSQDMLPAVTSTVIFQGIASDNNRVSKMYYVLGRTEADATTCTLPDCGSGQEHNCYWIDTHLDDTFGLYAKPQTHASRNYFGPGSIVEARWLGTLSNWQWIFPNIGDLLNFELNPVNQATGTGNYFVNHSGGTDPAAGGPENLWVLPVKFKVVDNAGNVHIEEVKVIIDPEKDRAVVEVNSHLHNPSLPTTVGGEVRISGTAGDNDWVHSVWIRAYKADAANNKIEYVPLENGAQNGDWTEVNYLSANKSPFISWNYTLNRIPQGETSGPLDPPEGVESHRILIELMAKDALAFPPSAQETPKSDGRIKQLVLRFSNAVPRVTDTQLIWGKGHSDIATAVRFPYEIGARASDFVTLVATIQDDERVTSISWNGQNPAGGFTGFQEVINNTTDRSRAFVRPTGSTIYGNNRYELFIPLDTKTIREGFYNNKAGSYTLNIQIQDNNIPAQTSTVSYSLQIDNYFPLANFTGSKNAVGNQYSISGNAWDREEGINVSGVERVVVYFSRPSVDVNNAALVAADFGTAINLTGGSGGGWVNNAQSVMVNRTGTPASETTPPLPPVLTNTGTSRNLPFFPDVQDASGNFRTTNTGIVISTSAPADGYLKSFSGDPDVRWSVRFDTTGFADGYVYVNYVVFDRARNATHYKELIYIANHRPKITSVSLGTDVDGVGGITGRNPNGSVNAGVRNEYRDFEISNVEKQTGFRIRNNAFELRLKTASAYGSYNNSLNYRVSYVAEAGITANNASISKGGVYGIENLGNNVPWRDYGVFDTAEVGYIFVATTTANLVGGARVTRYTGDTRANAFKQGTLNTANTLGTAITFDAASFGSIIPDSVKVNGEITGNNRNKRHFILKIYDGTIPGGAENEQLSFAGIISLDIDNTDQMAPKLDAAPFGQEYVLRTIAVNGGAHIENHDDKELKNMVIEDSRGFLVDAEYNKNIVTAVRFGTTETERKGYVQYGATAAAAADVSGKVIFSGRAADNRRIGRISYQVMPAVGSAALVAETVIARRNTSTGLVEPVNTIANMEADNAANRWGFEAIDQHITLEYGHVFNWRFAWDSSQIANQQGVRVIFRIYDDDSAAGNGNVTDTRNVNVVPYITEVITQLSSAMSATPSAFNRSALGWYPVREGETIEIKGFNFFSGTGTYTAPSIAIGGTSLAGTAAYAESGETAAMRDYRRKTHYLGTVASNTGSGALVVTTAQNNRASINNDGSNNAAYNKEPNGENNNRLTNDRYMYVWNVGHLVNRSAIQYPVLRVSSTGRRYVAFNEYISGADQFHILQDNTTLNIGATEAFPVRTRIELSGNRYLNTVLAVDNAGNWYAGISNLSSDTNPTYFAFHARGATSFSSDGFFQGGANKRRIISLYNSSGIMNSNRIRIPRIAAQAPSGTLSDSNATRIFMSYYDEHNTANPVVFNYGLAGDSMSSSSAGTGGQLIDVSTSVSAGHNTTSYQQVVANNSTTHKGSMYTAVGGLSNGLPVIAWYDRTNRRLVFSYGSGTAASRNIANGSTGAGNSWVDTPTGTTTTPNTWQGNAVIIREGVGTYVDMAVDEGDYIHMAYYDATNGGLYYTIIPPTGSGTSMRPNTGAIKTARVDTYRHAGIKLMINVRGTVPYISYFHGSFAETRNSVRVAWPKVNVRTTAEAQLQGTYHGDSVYPNDSFTGAWKVMTVPVHADSVPVAEETFRFISNGVPSGAWVTPTASGAVNYANIHESILVGYMTNQWYEGAALKYNILVSPNQ